MRYRRFGRIKEDVSALGLGVMRMPMKNGSRGYTGIDSGETDEEASIRIIRRAIDRGINYIDTAFNYLGGDSESIVGKALEDGYRGKVLLATKAPTWLMRRPGDLDSTLDFQLQRLQTDHIDVYLLHGMNRALWNRAVERVDIPHALERIKQSGKVRYIGFSFHDTLSLFEEIFNASKEWDIAQIQLNYMDTDYQAGLKGLAMANERGLGVSIMEPLRGGFLAAPPEEAIQPFKGFAPERSPVEWAFDFLWDREEVGVVLSGMGSVEEVEENISFAERSAPGMLSADEHACYDKVRDVFRSYPVIPCTGCGYCTGCPNRISIPHVFQAYNQYQMTKDMEAAKHYYKTMTAFFGQTADACIGCKTCEERCPQHIEIHEWMPKVDALFNAS